MMMMEEMLMCSTDLRKTAFYTYEDLVYGQIFSHLAQNWQLGMNLNIFFFYLLSLFSKFLAGK